MFCPCQEPLSCRLRVALCLQRKAKEFRDAECDAILRAVLLRWFWDKNFCVGIKRSLDYINWKKAEQTKTPREGELSQHQPHLNYPRSASPFLMLISCGEILPRNCSHSSLQQQTHKSQTPGPPHPSRACACSRLCVLLAVFPFSPEHAAWQLSSPGNFSMEFGAGCTPCSFPTAYPSSLNLPSLPTHLQSLKLMLVRNSRKEKGSEEVSEV